MFTLDRSLHSGENHFFLYNKGINRYAQTIQRRGVVNKTEEVQVLNDMNTCIIIYRRKYNMVIV